MVTLDKPEPSFFSQICQNFQMSCKRDYLRKRFVVRFGLLLLVLFLLVQLTGKSIIRFDVHFGEPDHQHESFFEYKSDINEDNRRAAIEKRAQDEMLQNLGGLQPPNKDNAVQKVLEPEKPKEPEKIVPVEPEFVHAFTGETKQSPVYLDFVDLNQPWDKAQEVSSQYWYQ